MRTLFITASIVKALSVYKGTYIRKIKGRNIGANCRYPSESVSEITQRNEMCISLLSFSSFVSHEPLRFAGIIYRACIIYFTLF